MGSQKSVWRGGGGGAGMVVPSPSFGQIARKHWLKRRYEKIF